MFDPQLFEFNHPGVRDLAWIIGSPPLMANTAAIDLSLILSQEWFLDQLQEYQPWLVSLDEQPEALERFLESRSSHRLGRYFEALVEFWLMHHEKFDLKKAGQQVIEGGQTLGEFDFLLYDRFLKKPFHWEVAVKFYLGYGEGSEWSSWIGPSANDRLDLKLNKLLHKQLHLGRTPAGQSILRDFGWGMVESRAFIKGQLFYHHSQGVSPQEAHPYHLRGWWCYFREASNLFSDVHRRWLLLPRKQWLATKSDLEGNLLLTGESALKRLLQLYEVQPLSVMIAGFSQHESLLWRETERGFIVPNTWPESGSSFGPTVY